ncbi:MAG: hypothetical protein GC164_08345 [Phycisphaera sp.]|nr:hypothetical protein [Phycisphaera sp.]
MAKSTNPFEHHHDHGHDHDHGHEHDHGANPPVLDPAQAALSDALRVCFTLLKFVMLALFVIYLFSGVFNVSQQQRAIRVFFGQIVGQEGKQVLEPGGPYLSLPFPLMKVVRIPVAPQDMAIDDAFWYSTKPGEGGQDQPLNPEKDGSLITGDANIIHAQWDLTYQVTDPVAFARNVGSDEAARQLVRSVVIESIIRSVAGVLADEASKGNIRADEARVSANNTLREIGAGIEVSLLKAREPRFPQSVQPAFEAVINADTRRGQLVTDAYRKREEMLLETAGQGYEALWKLVHGYERAFASGNKEQAQALTTRIDKTLDTLTVTDPDSGQAVSIGGQVAQLMYDAQSYKSNVVQRIKSEADAFSRLRDQWKDNRQVLEEVYLAQARSAVLSAAKETFWVPASGQVYLELNRDPTIARKLLSDKLKSEQDARLKNAGSN